MTPFTHDEIEALRPDRLNALGEMRGFNVGFGVAQDFFLGRILALETELERLREYVRADAYCPCCGDHGPTHGDGCDYRDGRIEYARAVLAGEKE